MHDRAGLLGDALASIAAQDHASIEVIVVDDGSRDGSADVARAHGVTCIVQEHLGPSAARNAALRVANGELVTFLDSDDELMPSAVSSMARHVLDHPGHCALGRQAAWLEPGTAVPPWMVPGGPHDDVGGVPFSTLTIRTETLRDAGGFDESVSHGEWLELLGRLRIRGVVIDVLDDVVLNRRVHRGNMTADDAAQLSGLVYAVRRHLELRRELDPQ